MSTSTSSHETQLHAATRRSLPHLAIAVQAFRFSRSALSALRLPGQTATHSAHYLTGQHQVARQDIRASHRAVLACQSPVIIILHTRCRYYPHTASRSLGTHIGITDMFVRHVDLSRFVETDCQQ